MIHQQGCAVEEPTWSLVDLLEMEKSWRLALSSDILAKTEETPNRPERKAADRSDGK